METTLYQIELKDGRKFKVFCANKHQKQRWYRSLTSFAMPSVNETLENGIHTIKQWEDIITKL